MSNTGRTFVAGFDDGVCTGFPIRKGDAYPQWPMRPFETTRRMEASVPLFAGDDESLDKYRPSRQNVATFRRWDLNFNPYDPQWPEWEALLTTVCGIAVKDSVDLDIPRILTILDQTVKPKELFSLVASLRSLSERLAKIESAILSEPLRVNELRAQAKGMKASTKRGKLEENARVLASICELDLPEKSRRVALAVSDLLLKTHDLPRVFYSLAQCYPGNGRTRFFRGMAEEIGIAADSSESQIVRRLADWIAKFAKSSASCAEPLPADAHEGWLTVKQVGENTGLSQGEVSRKCDSGELVNNGKKRHARLIDPVSVAKLEQRLHADGRVKYVASSKAKTPMMRKLAQNLRNK